MEIDVYIDSLTDCLVSNGTGELHDTEYRLVSKTISKSDAAELKREGLNFYWSIPQRKTKVVISSMDRFGEAMPDGRLTAPSENKVYRLREAIMQSKKLGRPLTESEMKQFEIN